LKYLLDTNVVSQRPKAQPHPKAMAWLLRTPAEDMRISAITIQEVRYGAESMDPGRRRRDVEEWLERDLLIGFADRILPVDAAVADECGRLIVTAKKKEKHNASLDDALIAATARVHGLQVATLNRTHFEKLGVDMVEF
jgi:predicted nucleic acid-binding protein